MDYRHLENQFKYLTKTVLTPVVNERFLCEIGKMEAYLREVNQSSQFCEEMEMIEVKCNCEFNGSEHYKWIQVLRKAGDMLDKEGMGSEFMRLESDGPPSFEGPFIKAINVEQSFVFEVWCDKNVLLANLSIIEALASFLHLAFVCDFKYSKKAETLCDIIQRRFAKYGDNTGSRGASRKETLATRRSNYLSILESLN